ncbi:MAG TPA: sigma-70 family RNA polymerase sigma factor [Acidimicrobiia bacterium]
MTDTRDRELIALVAGGDRDAFSELMARTEDMVFAVCLRIMGDREAARDAAQETFVTLFRKADRYKGTAAVTTCLYRVTVNTCYEMLRKSKRRRAESLPDHIDPADPQGGDGFISVELRGPVEEALRTLPEEFRTAVILRDVEGLSLIDVAEILDVPVGTVKSRVFRGRKLLAGELGNLQDGSERRRDDGDA